MSMRINLWTGERVHLPTIINGCQTEKVPFVENSTVENLQNEPSKPI